MAGLQRDGHLVGQYPAAGNIDNGGEVDVPPGHADIGRIQCPDLVGTTDDHLAQQIGIDLVLGIALAGARLRAQRFDALALVPRWRRPTRMPSRSAASATLALKAGL